MSQTLYQVARVLVPVAIFFVWVVRYENIVKEFRAYSMPGWTRDLVGILKLTFAVMIFSSEGFVLRLGAMGIVVLMLCALATHLKIKNPPSKMLPAFSLLCLSLYIFLSS